jgi:thiosulfate sulfurtransferase
MLNDTGKNAVLADVRDDLAFNGSHDERAFHLTNATYKKFKETVKKDQPVLVICYHGISSMEFGSFLI